MCVASVHLPKGNLRHVHWECSFAPPYSAGGILWFIQLSMSHAHARGNGAPGCLLSFSLYCSWAGGPSYLLGCFARRAWISFCLQPLIQSRWKGNAWGLSYARHWKGRCAADVAVVLSAGKTLDQSLGSATWNCESKADSQLCSKIVSKWV